MKSDPPKSLSVSIGVKTALDDELLTHEELAGRFKVKEREIHRRRTAGDIPFVLLGPKIIRYRWISVLEALENFERRGPLKPSPNPRARSKAPEVAKSDG